MIYLASPYTHADPDVQTARFFAACEAAAQIAAAGFAVFSPIAHSVPLCTYGAPDSADYWQGLDDAIMRGACDCVVVLCLDGWTLSRGVSHEVALAYGLGLPVVHADPEDVVDAAGRAVWIARAQLN